MLSWPGDGELLGESQAISHIVSNQSKPFNCVPLLGMTGPGLGTQGPDLKTVFPQFAFSHNWSQLCSTLLSIHNKILNPHFLISPYSEGP